MKGIVSVLCVFILSFSLSAQKLSIKINPDKVFIGKVKLNQMPVKLSFFLTNNGTKSETFLKPKLPAGCKLIRPVGNVTLNPNQSTLFEFSYTASNSGEFKEFITYEFKGRLNEKLLLPFFGEVLPKDEEDYDKFKYVQGNIRFESQLLKIGELKNNESKKASIRFYNSSKRTITFTQSEGLQQFVEIKIQPVSIEPRQYGWISVDYNAAKRGAFGIQRDSVHIESDDEKEPTKTLVVEADIFQDFSQVSPDKMRLSPKVYLTNTSYDFKFVKKGQEIRCTFMIKNRGKKELVIYKADASHPSMNVTYPPKVRYEKELPVEISMRTDDLIGKIHETITLITNDPNYPRIVLHIIGIVDDKK
jgi:hypothetical protein